MFASTVDSGHSLHTQRHRFVADFAEKHRVLSVLDVGCNTGALMRYLTSPSRKENSLRLVVGVDIDPDAVDVASRTVWSPLDATQLLHPCEVVLWRGNLLQRPSREFLDVVSARVDLVVCVEVIEHVWPDDLPAFIDQLCDTLVRCSAAKYLVLTTPDISVNASFGLEPGQLRHPDHKYEFAAPQFATLCRFIAERYADLWDAECPFLLQGIGAHKTLGATFFARRGGASRVGTSARGPGPVFPMHELFGESARRPPQTEEHASLFVGWAREPTLSIVLPWQSFLSRVRSSVVEGLAGRCAVGNGNDFPFAEVLSLWQLQRELSCTACAVTSALSALLGDLRDAPRTPIPLCDSPRCTCGCWVAVAIRHASSAINSLASLHNDDDSFLAVAPGSGDALEVPQWVRDVVIVANVGYCLASGDVVVLQAAGDGAFSWCVGAGTSPQ